MSISQLTHPERCPWAGEDPLYQRYHDTEWGRPVASDQRLFEKICLEGFQAGLSWITILRKRERFRAVFHQFDIAAVAAMGEVDIARLLGDPGIIRHRGKIAAALTNARQTQAVQREWGSFAAYIWSFEPPEADRPTALGWDTIQLQTQTDASRAMSKDLRRRGFAFVGPTTCYAFMQSMGLVNDHVASCACRAPVEAARAAFVRPEPTPPRP